MRVKYAGFNLYGQCAGTEKLIVDCLVDIGLENVEKISFTHSDCFMKINSEIYICPAQNSSINKSEKVLLPFDHKIKEFSSSAKRTLLLDEQGNIFKCEAGTTSVEQLSKFVNCETVDLGNMDYINKIVCGEHLAVAISQKNVLFNIPSKLNFTGSTIIKAATGKEHCLLLDSSGSVYSFGKGRGQLGHSTLEDEEEPQLIEAINGIKIIDIDAGGWHSCALSEHGDLYMWGWNSDGQIGIKTVNVTATPTLVDVNSSQETISDTIITKVACGAKHTIFLVDNSLLYGMGWNKYGQLGIDKAVENVLVPTKICDLEKNSVHELICGPWCSALLCK